MLTGRQLLATSLCCALTIAGCTAERRQEEAERWVATLEIPALHVNAKVGDGTSQPVLDAFGLGAYTHQAAPLCSTGTAGIAGNRTRNGSPFRQLENLRAGDTAIVRLRSGGGCTYVVGGADDPLREVTETNPDDLSVLEKQSSPRLSLTTCTPPGSCSKRLVIRLRLLDPAAKRACTAQDYTLDPGTEGAGGSGVLYAGPKQTGSSPCTIRDSLTFTLIGHETGEILRIPHNPLSVAVTGSFPDDIHSAIIVWGEPYCGSGTTDLLVTDRAGHRARLTDIVSARCDPATEHGTGPGLSVVRS